MTGSVLSVLPDRGHLPARPALLHRGHRDDRAEGVRPMRSRHDTFAAVFDAVYVALVTNLLLVLGCAAAGGSALLPPTRRARGRCSPWSPRSARPALCGVFAVMSPRTPHGRTPPRCCAPSAGPGGPRPAGPPRWARWPRRPWSCSASTPAPRWGHRSARSPCRSWSTAASSLAVATTLLGWSSLAERRPRGCATCCAVPAVPGGAPLVPHRASLVVLLLLVQVARGPPGARARPRRRAAALRGLGQQPLHAAAGLDPTDEPQLRRS